MTTERAQFEAELIDGISKPARRGERALDSLERRMRRFERGGAGSRGPRRGTGERLAGAPAGGRGLGRELTRQNREHARAEKRTASKEARDRKRRAADQKRSSERLSATLGGGLQTVAIAATGAVIAVGALAAKIGLAATDQAKFAQNSELAFDFLAKNGLTGIEIFDHVRSLAEEFGLDVQDTTHAYQKFLALQFSPKQSDDLVKLGADMRVLGATAEDVKGVFLQLGQIKAVGKAQMEELRPIMERGVAGEFIFEAMAKRMDVDASKIPDLISKGKVTADIAIPSLQDALLRKLQTSEPGEAGKKYADTTISGILERFHAKGQNLGIGLGQRIEAGLGKVGGKALERFDEWIQSDEADKTMGRTAERILEVAEGLEQSIPKIEAFFKGFGAGADEATSKLDQLFGLMGAGDADSWRENGRALGDLVVILAAVGTVAAMLTVPLLRVGEAIATSIIEPFASVAMRFDDAWQNIKAIFHANGMRIGEKAYRIGSEVVRAFGGGMVEMAFYPLNVAIRSVDNVLAEFDIGSEAREIGKTIITSLGDGITEFLMYPVKKAGEVADKVIGAFRETFDSHSPSRVLTLEGGNVSWGLGDGIEERGVYAKKKAIDVGSSVGMSMRGGLHAGASGGRASGGASKTFSRSFSLSDLWGGGSSEGSGGSSEGAPGSPATGGSRANGGASRPSDDPDIGPRTTAGTSLPSLDVGRGSSGGVTVQFGDVIVGGEGRESASEFMAAIRPQLIEFFEDLELAG